MWRRHRHQIGRFRWLLTNFSVLAGLFLALSFSITACARKDVGKLAREQPQLVLEEFFVGESVAYGIFEDRFGNLRRQFRVNLSGKWDGNKLVLDEEFLYDDGEHATRTWTIDRLKRDASETVTYQGKAADVKAAAYGRQVGNALNWQYDITLEISGLGIDVHFDDWI